MKALRTNDYLYVEYKTGEHELYDLRTDPYERRNIYKTAPPDLKQRLEAQLEALRKCTSEECRVAEGGESEIEPSAGNREQGAKG
jgi:arylsulfatase A-like enzyme